MYIGIMENGEMVREWSDEVFGFGIVVRKIVEVNEEKVKGFVCFYKDEKIEVFWVNKNDWRWLSLKMDLGERIMEEIDSEGLKKEGEDFLLYLSDNEVLNVGFDVKKYEILMEK